LSRLACPLFFKAGKFLPSAKEGQDGIFEKNVVTIVGPFITAERNDPELDASYFKRLNL
jgi:hypothetical protein